MKKKYPDGYDFIVFLWDIFEELDFDHSQREEVYQTMKRIYNFYRDYINGAHPAKFMISLADAENILRLAEEMASLIDNLQTMDKISDWWG